MFHVFWKKLLNALWNSGLISPLTAISVIVSSLISGSLLTIFIITSFSLDAGVEENATYSISLTGTGTLTQNP